AGNNEAQQQMEAYSKATNALDSGTALRAVTFSDDEKKLIDEMNLITAKPVLFVANVGEADLGAETAHAVKLREIAKQKGGEIVVICGELEALIAQLPVGEREEFLHHMGLSEPGLNVLIRAAYKLLDLETFFTAGPKEAH